MVPGFTIYFFSKKSIKTLATNVANSSKVLVKVRKFHDNTVSISGVINEKLLVYGGGGVKLPIGQ